VWEIKNGGIKGGHTKPFFFFYDEFGGLGYVFATYQNEKESEICFIPLLALQLLGNKNQRNGTGKPGIQGGGSMFFFSLFVVFFFLGAFG